MLNFVFRVALIIPRIALNFLFNFTFGLKNYTTWYDLNKLSIKSHMLKLKKKRLIK